MPIDIDELAQYLFSIQYPGSNLFRHMNSVTQEKYREHARALIKIFEEKGSTDD